MKDLRLSLLCATAAVFTPLGTAAAQTATGGEPAVVSEVIVTGSRIARQDYTAESPMVTVDEEFVEAAGPASLEATINVMPQFTSVAASASTVSNATRGGGRAGANLRGLGTPRTLVLMDGRRMQPSDAFGTVDLNTIAASLVQSVEVITGGASAVYGSDAIAGVVNFKLHSNFEGLVLDGQYGISSRWDADTYEVSATAGGAFAEGRGSALVSLSYLDRSAELRQSRPFFRDTGAGPTLWGGAIIPTATNLPSQASINTVFTGYGVDQLPPRNARFAVNPDGTLFVTTPVINYRGVPDHIPYGIVNNTVVELTGGYHPLQNPLERLTAFGRATYEITPAVEAYGQLYYVHYDSEAEQLGRPQSISNPITIPVTNPWLPDDLVAIMSTRSNPNARMTIYFDQARLGPTVFSNRYNLYQVVGGFRGDIAAIDGSWDIYASYGRTEQTETRTGLGSRDAYLQLVDAPDGGLSLCEGGFDPLSLERPSQDCLDFLLRESNDITTFDQKIVEGSVQGRLLNLPAGESRFALGFTHRDNKFDFRPDALRIAGATMGPAFTNPSSGSSSVWEGFGELLIPILSDMPFAERLDLNLAYRFSDYDTIGAVHTYKAGAEWEIVESLMLRGGYQRAIRAPSLGELFAPVEQLNTIVGSVANGRGDPCDFTHALRNGPNAAQVRQLCLDTGVPLAVIDLHRFTGTASPALTAGNPNLEEEVADTYTVGLVWRSNFAHPLLSRLSASIDYYDIEIVDAIGQITGEVILQRCFNADGSSNPTYDADNFYCSLTTRTDSGAFGFTRVPQVNLSGYRTEGVDLQVDWGAELSQLSLPDFGTVSLNAIVSYMPTYAIQTLAGDEFVNYAGTIGNSQISETSISHPEWKSVVSLQHELGPASWTLRWRWIDAMQDSSNVGATSGSAPGVEGRHYFDLTGRYEVTQNLEVRAGMLNVFDTDPPDWTGDGNTDVAVYDILGRRFYFGARVSF